MQSPDGTFKLQTKQIYDLKTVTLINCGILTLDSKKVKAIKAPVDATTSRMSLVSQRHLPEKPKANWD